jgi:major membrane immunogen (membrane-anchored lipoprotein)
MKKGFSLILVSLLALAVFAACAKDAALYKNGTYTAAYDARDSHGWKPVLEIVIEKGKIVSATFDYVNAAGKLKSQMRAMRP